MCEGVGPSLPILSNLSVVGSGQLYRGHFGYNQLTMIPDNAFRNIIIFSHLNLTHNLLEYISMSAFRGLERKLVGLDLSYNEFTNIPIDALTILDFISTLKMSHNKVTSLGISSIAGIADTIEELHLDYNGLQTIDEITFLRASMLRYLSVAHNPLLSIDFVCTQPLTRLASIDLSGLHLIRIDQYCFKGSPALETVRADDNELSSLEFVRHLANLKYLYISHNHMHYLDSCDVKNLPLRWGSGFLDYSENPVHCTCELAWLATQPGLSAHCDHPLEAGGITLRDFVSDYCISLRDSDFVCISLEITDVFAFGDSITIKWRSIITEDIIGFVVNLGAHREELSIHRESQVNNRSNTHTFTDLLPDSEYHVCVVALTRTHKFGQRQCLTLETEHMGAVTEPAEEQRLVEEQSKLLNMYQILCTIFLALLLVALIVIVILACILKRTESGIRKYNSPSFINSTYGKITRKFKQYRSNSTGSAVPEEDFDAKPAAPSVPPRGASCVQPVGSGTSESTTRTSLRSDATLPLPPIPSSIYRDNIIDGYREQRIRIESSGSEIGVQRQFSQSDYEELQPRRESTMVDEINEHLNTLDREMDVDAEKSYDNNSFKI